MRRERELKLLRKKKLIKRYSDFELGLLASEFNDYTYLLKSIQFPMDEFKVTEKEKEKEKEEMPKNNNNKNQIQKVISLEEIKEEKIKNKKDEESGEEYDGLKVKGIKGRKKRK